ncbi:hypothetical protein CMV_007606 [Castanea mollissima]|uniref:Uncharacterized protein n=1 Tax=Castanea mollissima TaxID=60419 RepID=A0A8J4VQ31_9ROSI|nr:hypothetical protein CMV_007606 [Castanea mollissima]
MGYNLEVDLPVNVHYVDDTDEGVMCHISSDNLSSNIIGNLEQFSPPGARLNLIICVPMRCVPMSAGYGFYLFWSKNEMMIFAAIFVGEDTKSGFSNR